MDIEKISSTRLQVPPDRILDPHNTYTGALAEYGLLGFLAIVTLFINFIAMLFGRGKTKPDILSYCLLAGLLGFLFNALFIDIMTMRHFWIFLAAILIFYKNRKEAYDALKI
jgi:O-antigen ligase